MEKHTLHYEVTFPPVEDFTDIGVSITSPRNLQRGEVLLFKADMYLEAMPRLPQKFSPEQGSGEEFHKVYDLYHTDQFRITDIFNKVDDSTRTIIVTCITVTPIVAPGIYKCQNCSHTAHMRDFPPAKDIFRRIEVGDMYSDKECPKCGALAFPLNLDFQE